MALGYDGKLYILAFDHRDSFQKKMFGIEGDLTQEETQTIADAKKLIFEGMLEAVRRGADDAKVDHWLTMAAPVDGFVGFAIGRSIWWDALKGFLDGSIERADAARQIADNYLRFVRVYQDAESAVAAS